MLDGGDDFLYLKDAGDIIFAEQQGHRLNCVLAIEERSF